MQALTFTGPVLAEPTALFRYPPYHTPDLDRVARVVTGLIGVVADLADGEVTIEVSEDPLNFLYELDYKASLFPKKPDSAEAKVCNREHR